MSSVDAATGPVRAERVARSGTGMIFLLHGMAFGSWAVRIPWITETLDLSPGTLGLALLASAAGGVAAMPITGRLIARFGSRVITRLSVILVAVSVALPPYAPDAPALAAALALFGASGGLLDVAMNAQGVEVEARYRRPIMPSLHGLWSLGGLIGSALGGLVAEVGVGAPVHLVVVGVVVFVIGVPVGLLLLPGERSPAAPMRFVKPTKGLLLVGLLGFCSLFAEAAAADWSAVYLRTATDTSPGVAAAGYAAFSIAMMTGRLLGNRVVTWVGPVALVRVTALAGSIGLTVGLLVPVPAVVVAAFAFLGLGVAYVIPLAFSAAGNRRDRHHGDAIATVATVSYAGWLAAPGIVGTLAEATSLRFSLATIACLVALMAVLAGALRPAGAAAAGSS